MDVASFPGKLDELAGQKITKLVFLYDRGYMHPRLLDTIRRFTLKTTEMPLNVCVYAQEKVIAKYSFKPPLVSGYTWQITINAHPEILFTILRKALTPNGPKHYTFRGVSMYVHDRDIYLAHSLYRCIGISCWLKVEPPTDPENCKKLGKGGECLFECASIPNSYFRCDGHHEGYLDKIRIYRKLKKVKRQASE